MAMLNNQRYIICFYQQNPPSHWVAWKCCIFSGTTRPVGAVAGVWPGMGVGIFWNVHIPSAAGLVFGYMDM